MILVAEPAAPSHSIAASAYVHALGGKLAIEAEIDGELFRYELT